MSSEALEANKDIVRRAVAAMSRGDVDGFMADAADDVTVTVIGTTFMSGTFTGKEKILEGLRRAIGDGFEGGGIPMEIDNLIAEGDFVAEQAHGNGRSVTGKDYANTYCRVWRIVDGEVLAMTEYLDTQLLAEVMGRAGPDSRR